MKSDYIAESRGGLQADIEVGTNTWRSWVRYFLGLNEAEEPDSVAELLRATKRHCGNLAYQEAREGVFNGKTVEIEDGLVLAKTLVGYVDELPKKFLVIIQNPLVVRTFASGEHLTIYTGIIPFVDQQATSSDELDLHLIPFFSRSQDAPEELNWGFVPGRSFDVTKREQFLNYTYRSRDHSQIASDYLGPAVESFYLAGDEGYIPAHTYIFDADEVTAEEIKAVFDGDVAW